VLLSIFGVEAQDAPPQNEAMPPLEEGVAEARQEGAPIPREQLVHDQAALLLPLHGRPWARHGSVPRGALLILN
jgi:hypothetical protein